MFWINENYMSQRTFLVILLALQLWCMFMPVWLSASESNLNPN